MRLAEVLFGKDPAPAVVVAEIGGNFRTFDEARALIDAARACGADAVKLQTYRAATVASRHAMFDMENTGRTSQYELFRKYEIDGELHRRIFACARAAGLDVFSTPSHETDVDLLEELGVEAYKIGSDDAVNLPFLRHVAARRKPVILATGMCTMEEVRESAAAILAAGDGRLALLHAVTSYPTPPEDVNLLAMCRMMEAFPLPVGYSDHTLGTTACVAAAALGARLLEKHFTLDKAAEGPDHMLSADPAEMRRLVAGAREAWRMRGTGRKAPAPSERTTRTNNRKSIVAARALPAGHRIGAGDIAVKRPGTGIPPASFDRVVGMTASRAVAEDEVLSWGDLR